MPLSSGRRGSGNGPWPVLGVPAPDGRMVLYRLGLGRAFGQGVAIMDFLLFFLVVTVSVGIYFVCRAIYAAGHEHGFRDGRKQRRADFVDGLCYWQKFLTDSFRKEVRR